MPVSSDPGIELTPGRANSLVGPMVNRPRHLRGAQLACLDAPNGRNRPCDRHADLEIKGRWIHPQVMREPWPSWGDALGGNGGHQLADTRTHDGPDLCPGMVTWMTAVEFGGLYDLWCVEHYDCPRVLDGVERRQPQPSWSSSNKASMSLGGRGVKCSQQAYPLRITCSGLPRQGPGDATSTMQVLALVPGVGPETRVLDVGCVTGEEPDARKRRIRSSVRSPSGKPIRSSIVMSSS